MHDAIAGFGLHRSASRSFERKKFARDWAKAARHFLLAALFGTCAHAAEPDSPVLASNGAIAFTSDRDGNQEIYIMNADGTEPKRLTNNPGIDDFPSFSPDGKKIAFVSQDSSGGFALKVMKADGAELTEITPLTFETSPYPWHHQWSSSWSPDGSKIAFEEGGDIFVVRLDGSGRRNLTHDPSHDMEPVWSPDGSRILFISSRVYWLTLHVMNAADGSDVRELPSAGEFWDVSPDFSPTGGKIAFVVNSEIFPNVLYTANPDGTERQVFDACGGGLCSTHRNKPRWSPDEKKIVFQMWEYFGNDAQIYVKPVDGGERAQLTTGPGRNFHPSWQPLWPTAPEAE